MAVQQFLMMGRAAAGRTIITGQRWVALDNTQGVTGLGDATDNRTEFAQLGDLETWQNIESPASHADNRLVVISSGALWVWGRNHSGTLGIGNTTQKTSPVQVGSDTDWLEAATVASASMAIKTNGTLWTWGDASSGQLGSGNTTARSSPAQVGSDTDWSHILLHGAVNHDVLFAMNDSGEIYYSGTGFSGLGNVSSFTQIASEDGFKDVVMIGTGIVAYK
jgi:alpha-tubulin suppressor-like RCC1 family protein